MVTYYLSVSYHEICCLPRFILKIRCHRGIFEGFYHKNYQAGQIQCQMPGIIIVNYCNPKIPPLYTCLHSKYVKSKFFQVKLLVLIHCVCSLVHNVFITTWIIVRPVLVVNVFLVTRPHAILEAACFGHYCHYLALRMLSSITKINVTILSVVCPGNVQIVQDMLR